MSLNTQAPAPPQVVPYMDLGGGLNTRLEPHALARNELAVSQNLWPSYDRAVTKRPGTIPLITANGMVTSTPTKSLMSCRFNSVTYLLHVSTLGEVRYAALPGQYGGGGSTTWTAIGTVATTAAFTTCAQMFDPNSQVQQVFICDGVSIPQMWAGPGSTLINVPTGAGYLPYAFNSTTNFITPQYVKSLGNNSLLFYSGEPTNTSAVYISDPFYPTQFNYAAQQVSTNPTQQYNPAIVGNNDGVEGGIITGMETIGSVMVVFKEAAVYTMVQTTLLGEVVAWQVIEVSNSTGNLAPRSIVRFDQFITFVGVDGVYYTDGTQVQSISDDVPTYFDGSLNGVPALCTNRTATLGVRHGPRLELFFPTGTGAAINTCNTGLWFDFSKQSRFGHPLAGEIDGMNVGGVVALRGPWDSGNVAWGTSVGDFVGEFGVGHADNGNPITSTFFGKADLFDDVFGPEATISEKQAQDAYLLVELSDVAAVDTVDFWGSVQVDLVANLQRALAQPIATHLPGDVWGSPSMWGQMVFGASSGAEFFCVKIPLQNNARGRLFQIGITETSIAPWVIIGYAAYVNVQKVGY